MGPSRNVYKMTSILHYVIGYPKINTLSITLQFKSSADCQFVLDHYGA